MAEEVDSRIPESLKVGVLVDVYNHTQGFMNRGTIKSSFFGKNGLVGAHIQIEDYNGEGYDVAKSYTVNNVLSIGVNGESSHTGAVRHYTSSITHDLNVYIDPITE